MIRVSDYIVERLVDFGVSDIFLVTGGGAMHLNDAIGRCESINYICCHHEQACAMAAEGYARIKGSIGVVNVTTGPGGINALNGVFGAWTDSIPLLIISGQVKRETALYKHDLIGRLRQLGDQEVDIVGMVKGITKYAVTVDDPISIRYHLEKALFLATTGRPGPVWIDIPLDVQGAFVNKDSLYPYIHVQSMEGNSNENSSDTSHAVKTVLSEISKAKRPVIIAGTGIRISKGVDIFREVIEKLGIPVTTAWTHDLLPSDHELFCGRPGTIGDRGGNFTVQNADLVLIIGSRLNIRQVSYNWKSFARNALKIMVDIDYEEMRKPTVTPDMAFCCDANRFLSELNLQIEYMDYQKTFRNKFSSWLKWCRERYFAYPAYQPQKHISTKDSINPYHFCHEVFTLLDNDDIIVCGNASACIIPFQVAKIKSGQRMFSNSGSASMGYDLPAAIGAAIASKNKRIVCFAGDGSIQMNIQELSTIAHHNLPIKIFLLNNSGYLSIRETQKNFFGTVMGADKNTGLGFPDFVSLAKAYSIEAIRICEPDFTESIRYALSSKNAILCEVLIDPNQGFEPKISSKRLEDGSMISTPLEDMYPFLSREEFLRNILPAGAKNE